MPGERLLGMAEMLRSWVAEQLVLLCDTATWHSQTGNKANPDRLRANSLVGMGQSFRVKVSRDGTADLTRVGI